MQVRWRQILPHCDQPGGTAPCPREAPGALTACEGKLYLFGGGTAVYGTPDAPGDLTRIGALNDLWCFDPNADEWTLIQPNDNTHGFVPGSARPGSRMLPSFVSVDNKLYLFGGLTVVEKNWHFEQLKDLWLYNPPAEKWTRISPDDGKYLAEEDSSEQVRAHKNCGMGMAVIGDRIYLFGGWSYVVGQPKTLDTMLISMRLMCYDITRGRWKDLGPGENWSASRKSSSSTTGSMDEPWPNARYCPAMTACENRLFLWGGRDTRFRPTVFYNDLWEYNPDRGTFTCLIPNDPEAADRPSPRYAMGQTLIGQHWYVFGGFASRRGDGPQLNDLWRLDLNDLRWECLIEDNGSHDYSTSAVRPGRRRVPGMTSLANSLYLFGGLDLASGPQHDGPLIALNDLWEAKTE